MTEEEARARRHIFLGWLKYTVPLMLGLFLLAGRLDMPLLWLYAVMRLGLILATIFSRDPNLTQLRLSHGPDGIDPVRLSWIRMLFPTHLAVGALDGGRLHWSPVPPVTQTAALVVFAISMGSLIWAIAVNRYFIPALRIQDERGHAVVSHGPYRWVRHPGYAAMAIAALSSALALDSWIAVIPAMLYAMLLFRRTAEEDRFLRSNLDGYTDYALRVRYRVVPGLW